MTRKAAPKMTRDATIGPQSRISLMLLSGIFFVTVTASWGGARWATRVENRLEQIERSLAGDGQDRWTESDMKAWATELGLKNPNLTVPVVEHKYRKDK